MINESAAPRTAACSSVVRWVPDRLAMKEWELHSQWVNDLPESIETIKQPSNLGDVKLLV